MAEQDRAAMLQKLREKMTQRKGGSKRDPGEWKPPQVQAGEEFKAKAFILPGVEVGEACSSGKAQVGMDGLFFVQVGDHWIDKKRYPCPRIYDNDECPYCQLGFNLLNETEDKKARSDISKAYLPRTQYVANLFFPDVKSNPEELRGQVKFVALPKTIFDKLEECIQQDSAGDDPDDPKPWGIFYDPQDAYPLSLVINRKGDYNNYTDSKLLANGRGKIAATQKEIAEVLAQRHDIPAKYPERSPENRKALQAFVDALLNGTTEATQGGGFDTDEAAVPAKTAPAKAPTQTQAAKPATTAKPKTAPKSESKAEVELEESESEAASPTQVEDEELQALLNSIKKSD